MPQATSDDLPLIDVAPLVDGEVGSEAAAAGAARAIDGACRRTGFFQVVGHGVDPALLDRLEVEARGFFALADEEKAAIGMVHGGRAWRGWFPAGGELTSGVPDRKEGLYFGTELADDDPPVRAGLPLHGPNLFPAEPAGLRPAVLDWIDALTGLGHRLVRGVALGLGLDADWFDRHLTADPVVLFRIFRYPPARDAPGTGTWGVAEHTDYGLLTILAQDANGGLEVRTPGGWIDVPAQPGTFVCNVGDMLDRITGGRYRSTPHRVRTTDADRLSFPFFFDPGWDAVVRPIPLADPAPGDDADRRWDGRSVHAFHGTYGDYLREKVAKVFPELATDHVDTGAAPPAP